MPGRLRSEKRQRTEHVLVRLTPAEKALVDAAVRQERARGAGTVLREAFLEKWQIVAAADEALRAATATGRAPGQPDTTPPLPAAQRPAQACAGATEPIGGFSPAAHRAELRRSR